MTLYGICWIAAAFFDRPFAHALMDPGALGEKEGVWGVANVAVAGSLMGALFAILYNLTSFVDEIALRRRPLSTPKALTM